MFPGQSYEVVMRMSDRDIVSAFFPNQRPGVSAKASGTDFRKLFWSIGHSRGMSERQIQAAWTEQYKGK